MNLRKLSLKKAYDSDVDNVLLDFYVPALSASSNYFRLSGFFSSTSLAVASKGITGLIKNNGQIRLVTGAKFSKEDIDAIKNAYEDPEELLQKNFFSELDNLENEFIRDHVRALGWMIANKKLKIKIAFVVDSLGLPLQYNKALAKGIFHQKVGILEDSEGNKISFSGSDNETGFGWKNNIEEFKVFRSWVETEKQYFITDLSKFEKFWNGEAKRTKIIDIPVAIKERLIEISPSDIEELKLDRWITRRTCPITFRGYQEEAISNWLNNKKRGIFEMATGTGKTITALGCLIEAMGSSEKEVIVIASPFIHLSNQWEETIDKFGIKWPKFFADSSQTNWKNRLADNLLDIENGINDRLVIFTTHNTLSSDDFIQMIKQSKKRVPLQSYYLIVDEVHGIGAPERKKGLIAEYDFRLGLSATPKRWYDLEGTQDIFDYFGEVVFRFSLKDAIRAGFLTQYIYVPHFVKLTPQEMEQYKKETRKIVTSYYASKDNDEKNRIFTLLCIKRARIIRNAENKMIIFKKILEKLGDIRHCLVYCSPQQIRNVQDILNKRNVIQHKFTQKEGTKNNKKYGWQSERDFLIKRFADGFYHTLVSMRCLDEELMSLLLVLESCSQILGIHENIFKEEGAC
ncbi:MAG: DEAD/DEAH box helicase family protein [Candidatus Bathyarchaeota archaeon]